MVPRAGIIRQLKAFHTHTHRNTPTQPHAHQHSYTPTQRHRLCTLSPFHSHSFTVSVHFTQDGGSNNNSWKKLIAKRKEGDQERDGENHQLCFLKKLNAFWVCFLFSCIIPHICATTTKETSHKNSYIPTQPHYTFDCFQKPVLIVMDIRNL